MKRNGALITAIGAFLALVVIRTTLKSQSGIDPTEKIGMFLPAIAFLFLATGLVTLFAGYVKPNEQLAAFCILAIAALSFVVALSAAIYPVLARHVGLVPEPTGIFFLIFFSFVHKNH